jgi:hypothetical protein
MKMSFTRSFRRYLRAGFLFYGFILWPSLYAQESARIYNATGSDFTVSLNGERKVYQAGAAGGNGITLERSGIVYTGEGTFLDIQLSSSGAVVKLSENTSFIYNGIDWTGKIEDIGLLYGRIRVIASPKENPSGIDSIVVRSGGVSARIREGDFGADYLLNQVEQNAVPRSLFLLHAFKGNAEAFPYGMGASSAYFGGINILNIRQGESLFMDISSLHTFAEKRPLARDVQEYWRLENIVDYFYISPEQEKKTAMEESRPVVSEFGIILPDPVKPVQPSVSSNRGKNICLAIGWVLTVAGVAAQVIAYPRYEHINNADLSWNIHNAAYVSIGMGLATILGGILYNPSKP